MDKGQAEALCDKLWDCIYQGPGVVNASALTEARTIVGELRAAQLGAEIDALLEMIVTRFKTWFSERAWCGEDAGVSFQAHLQADIINLKVDIGACFRPDFNIR